MFGFGPLLMGIQILRLAEFTVSVPVLIRFITGCCGTFLCLRKLRGHPDRLVPIFVSLMLTEAVNASFPPLGQGNKRTCSQPSVHFQPKSALVFHRGPPPTPGLYLLHNPGAHLKILKPAAKLCLWTVVQPRSWEVREPSRPPPSISFGFLRTFFFVLFSKHAVPIPGTKRGQ